MAWAVGWAGAAGWVCAAATGNSTSSSPPPATAPASQPAANPEIESLIRRLAAPRWRDREAAQDRLGELDAAEGALRAALKSAADSQTRLGAERALGQLLALRNLGPTRVSLHVKDAPLQDVFAELSRQSRLPIRPFADGLWRQKDEVAVTLDLTDRPFWEAMRAACAAGGLRPLYATDPERLVVNNDPTREMDRPAAFSGSFMVVATDLTRRLVSADESGKTGDFELQLKFFADPKWHVLDHPSEAPIDQVLDAAGQLLPRPPAMRMQVFTPQFPIWMMRTVLTRVPLEDGKLRRVRGSFRITLLEEARPVEFGDALTARNVVRRVGRQAVQLQEMQKIDNGYKVKLTVFRNGLSSQLWRQAREAEGIALLDAAGRAYKQFSVTPQDDGIRASYDVTFFDGAGGPNAPGPPARVVCQIPLEPRDATVPFELTDLAWDK